MMIAALTSPRLRARTPTNLPAIVVALQRTAAILFIALMVTSCGTWRGMANVPLPGGPGTGTGSYTVYVQIPDTLGLNVNSRVRVADVYVGRVQAIGLKKRIATLTLTLDPDVNLPANAVAKIGQTSLLGTQHVELAAPSAPSAQRLRNGDTIPLQDSSAFPTTERTLASIATVLRGGGIPSLDVITTEVDNVLTGNGDQVRDFLDQLDTFTAELNKQRDDITRAIDSTDHLLAILADQSATLNNVLTEFPKLISYFANQQALFINAVEALGRFSDLADHTVSAARGDLATTLQLLQRPLKQLGRAAPLLVGALKLLLTLPFTIDNVPKVVRGDSMNVSATLDLTLSALDNGLLTGTRFSGALRALEQSWGRDPNTMIPDVRFTPNPSDAPGGPLVERAEQ
jgi:phospholipid/cholesterol/gamma-HCH transport system substrate-binding protein